MLLRKATSAKFNILASNNNTLWYSLGESMLHIRGCVEGAPSIPGQTSCTGTYIKRPQRKRSIVQTREGIYIMAGSCHVELTFRTSSHHHPLLSSHHHPFSSHPTATPSILAFRLPAISASLLADPTSHLNPTSSLPAYLQLHKTQTCAGTGRSSGRAAASPTTGLLTSVPALL